MNPYLKNLNKIEFIVTYACTGRCRHCSQGEHTNCGTYLDSQAAAEAVRKIAAHYPIQTVMTFGGEPLLYPDVLYPIHEAARKMGIPKRQLITNGFFSRNREYMERVAENLTVCGVNEILLSVDAFHQESIPLEPVMDFASAIKKRNIPLLLQPAWLVSADDENPFNRKTREILSVFREMGFSENDGNIVFCEGNAQKYFGEYFTAKLPENPYIEDPADIRCVSIDPAGDVLQGNWNRTDILEILQEYRPE